MSIDDLDAGACGIPSAVCSPTTRCLTEGNCVAPAGAGLHEQGPLLVEAALVRLHRAPR
jgi:hypothetical protein